MTPTGSGAGFTPGTVLDCFMGSGTTALVARRLNRKSVGIELNAEYCEMAAIDPPDDVVLACCYLEARNRMYSIHFDFEDAVAKAEDLYQTEWKRASA